MILSKILFHAKTQIESLDAEILACEVFGLSGAGLILSEEKEMDETQKKQFIDFVERRKNGQSVSEILGKKEFYGNVFCVTNDVLTPRPETEILVEKALEHIQKNNIQKIIDIGTGSGCIAVTLAKELESFASVIASDISEKVLNVARKNAKNLLLEMQKISFRKSDLISAFTAEELKDSCIVTNLPYIPLSDVLSDEVMNGDPELALFSGTSGADLYLQLFENLPKNIDSCFFEFHPPQKELFQKVCTTKFPHKSVSFFADYAGHERFGMIV